MNTTRHYLICSVLATLALVAGSAWAQKAPATAPKAAAPAAAAAQPNATATPPDRSSADTADATNAADDNDDSPQTTTTDDSSSDDAPVVWTRDRARGWRGPRFHASDDDIVSVGGDSTFTGGRRVDSVVSVFGSSTSSGDVGDAVVSVFGNTRIEGGTVGDAAVAVLGNTYVNSQVDGDVVAVLGDVELGPQANVRGNVVVVGGHLIRDTAAQIHGSVQHVMSIPSNALIGVRSWLSNCLRYLRPLAFAPGLGWAWTLALGFLALYALFAVLFREPFDRCVKTLQERPGETIVASILTMLLTPVLYMVLGITLIGIPFIPLMTFGMFLLTLFGKAVVLAWIGRGVLKLASQDEGIHSAIAVLVGGVIVLALYVVPVVGFILFNLLGLLGLGVVVYTFLRASRARRSSVPPSSGTRMPGTGPAPGAPAAGPSAGTANAAPAAPAGAAPYTAGFSADAAGFGGVDADGTRGTASSGSPDTASAAAGASSAADSGGFAGPSGGGFAGGAGAASPPPGVSTADALSLPRAGFWIRMLALLIDAVIVGVVFSVLDHHSRLQLVAIATYGAIMWKLKGTTVGGIVCNLRIIRLDGREIDWSTAIVRALGCFLSLIVCGLGFIWIAFDPGRQAWHDKIAGTAVVRVPQGVSLL